MRTILRALLLGISLFNFHSLLFSQQVAKSIPYPASPDGRIGFLQFTPSDYGSQKHPLIIFLHGIGERGDGTPSQLNNVTANAIPRFCAAGASMRFTVNGQTSSFVVLSPQLSVQYGYWPTFYITEMIKYAKANLQIDPNRIYITGLSLGGGGIWRMITDASTYIASTNSYDYGFDGTIAAAAPVCGTQEETDANMCTTIGANHLPVWAFHSMDDGTVGVGATQHAEILTLRCGMTPPVKYTYYQSGGHAGAWINAFDTGHITVPVNVNGAIINFTASPNLYEWFLSNTRGNTQQIAYTAPVANAGSAQSITLPVSSVNLSGSGSGTNGATISSYGWTKTSGPSSGSITNANAASTSVTGLTAGTYVFTLTVTDNRGLTNSSSVTVTVNAAANTPPVANAGSNINLVLPVNYTTLNATGSTDAGGITGYSWKKTSGPDTYTIVNPAGGITALTGLVQGTYVFTVTVTDNVGATASSSVTVNVNAAAASNNYTPVANAGNNLNLVLPVNYATLNATGSTDPSGIASYSWKKTSGPDTYTIVNPAGGITALTGLIQGAYVFTVTITDNGGATASASVAINVNAPGSYTPVANAGSNSIITLPVNYAMLDATGSSDVSGIASYSWKKTSGPDVYTIVNPIGGITLLTGLVQGVYVFTVTVADNSGATASSSVTITVNSAPSAPAALPAQNNTFLGYIKMAIGGAYQACGDASTSGRIAVYGTGISNGNILYTDAALTQKFAGDWSWYSITPSIGGAVAQAFAIYPDGSINLLTSCSPNAPAAQPTPPASNILGYIKLTIGGYYQACGDGTSAGRIAVYGNGIYNGSVLYTDAALTQPYNGSWSWFSYTQTLGGLVTQAFAIYPDGSIMLQRSCTNGGARIAQSATTVEQDEAALKSIQDSASAAAALNTALKSKLIIYPNPVSSAANIQLYSNENSVKVISVYDSKGVLKAKYTWQTIRGTNTFPLKNAAALTSGLYIIDISDSNGKPVSKLKFIKM